MWSEFNLIFKVPDVAKNHIQYMIKDDERVLVVAVKHQEFTAADASKLLNISPKEADELVDSAYKRGILNKVNEKNDVYVITDFYTRLKYVAVFDDYEVIPLEDRNKIDEWYVNAFIEKHEENFKKLKDKKLDINKANYLYSHAPFLLDQVYEAIDAADRILALPCDCNQLSEDRTDKSEIYHCIHFDNYADGYLERKLGKVLTKEECKEIVKKADKKGFMHCVNLSFKEDRPGFICNCNPKWCYPFRAAKIMNSEDYWPLRRNVASHQVDKCKHCGLCVKRCPFGVFKLTEEKINIKGRDRKQVVFEPSLCWGCGLCANTCPEKAIAMHELQ